MLYQTELRSLPCRRGETKETVVKCKHCFAIFFGEGPVPRNKQTKEQNFLNAAGYGTVIIGVPTYLCLLAVLG